MLRMRGTTFGLGLLFSQLKPDVVVLLAAVSHASRSNKDPYHTFDHSFRTLENALDSSRSNGRAFHLLLLQHGLWQL
jgi:nucleoside-diphosphate-sugar epimerase